MKAAEELNDTLETEASSSMRRCTILESIDVVFDLLDWNSAGLSSLSFSVKHYSNSLTTTVEPFVKLFSAFLKKSTLHNLVIIIWLIGLLLWQKNRNGSGLDTPDVSAKVRNRASWERTKIMMFFYIHWEIWISKVFGNLNACIKSLPFTQNLYLTIFP